ncbi:hypothetical protein ACIBF5_14935 [Micromonospora sp. NPDC050417]|uniref:hypothetical protein n=1 Tax=Micromonospora sp. NPDC050417 TaxID=3364280 RepID=UPI00379AA6DB
MPVTALHQHLKGACRQPGRSAAGVVDRAGPGPGRGIAAATSRPPVPLAYRLGEGL